MDFNTNEAIYLQIADYVCDRIQLQDYKEDEKIPSVRELAITLAVSPNTLMRAYDYLQQQNIIFTKRGMGFFVQTEAAAKILSLRKQQFLTEELPTLFKKLELLKIDFKDLEAQFNEYKSK